MSARATQGVRVCLVSFGSAGDVHPMLALGRSLRARGHAVSLLSNPAWAAQAGRDGLDFEPVGAESDYRATIEHPKLWHPIDGFGVMWRYLLRPALVPTYEALAALASRGPCVAIASPVAMGARVAQEKLGLPLITAYTAATLLRTVHDPMTLAHWDVAPWWPGLLRRGAWALLDRYKLEPLVRPSLDALRSSVGLPVLQDKVFARWMHSPQAGVTLFPPWFAPAPPDWPAQVVQAGFPLYDGDAAEPPSAALQAFVQGGTAPLVFMPGTAAHAVPAFYEAAQRACEHTGHRGLLLGPVDEALKARLPACIHAAPYAPFAWLLPRARALVHHGGIGSSAQALRAGIPQLLVPQAYDQFDNAMRLRRLGVGRSLPRGMGDLPAMGDLLADLLASPAVARACAHWAAQTTPQAAQDVVRDLVERLA